jgi:rfaE bifunctional protein nucleotidyltransferase chain/domain
VSSADKVVSRDDLLRRAAGWRAAGKTVALANGLFDIFHVGHLRYLEEAATLADVLVVASTTTLRARPQGSDRPIVPQDERAEAVAGFRCVTLVTLFGEATVEPLLRALVPAVHCKGTDYTTETVPERETARELGIKVAITGDPKTHATRDLIKRMRESRKDRLFPLTRAGWRRISFPTRTGQCVWSDPRRA